MLTFGGQEWLTPREVVDQYSDRGVNGQSIYYWMAMGQVEELNLEDPELVKIITYPSLRAKHNVSRRSVEHRLGIKRWDMLKDQPPS